MYSRILYQHLFLSDSPLRVSETLIVAIAVEIAVTRPDGEDRKISP